MFLSVTLALFKFPMPLSFHFITVSLNSLCVPSSFSFPSVASVLSLSLFKDACVCLTRIDYSSFGMRLICDLSTLPLSVIIPFMYLFPIFLSMTFGQVKFPMPLSFHFVKWCLFKFSLCSSLFLNSTL